MPGSPEDWFLLLSLFLVGCVLAGDAGLLAFGAREPARLPPPAPSPGPRHGDARGEALDHERHLRAAINAALADTPVGVDRLHHLLHAQESRAARGPANVTEACAEAIALGRLILAPGRDAEGRIAYDHAMYYRQKLQAILDTPQERLSLRVWLGLSELGRLHDVLGGAIFSALLTQHRDALCRYGRAVEHLMHDGQVRMRAEDAMLETLRDTLLDALCGVAPQQAWQAQARRRLMLANLSR
jgi:hypothetical protein